MAVTVRYGSQGDEVKRLQQALNRQGYNLTVDGIFGTNTQNAVKQYQQKNGLSVDGIAGAQTWGKLLGGSTAQAAAQAANMANPDQTPQTAQETAPQTATTARGTTYDPAQMTGTQADLSALEAATPTFRQTQALSEALDRLQGLVPQERAFQGSDALNEALAGLQTMSAAKPAEYVSPYSEQIEQMYQQAVAGRQPFQYDASADPLYQMYKDRYTQNARQAMEDTMANAAALTGGYGNSYAAAAAQQAYDQQMGGLNYALPQLYEAAYGRWRDEGDDALRRLQLAREMDEAEYSRYSDRLADYYRDMEARRALASDMYNREYGQYSDERADEYDRLAAQRQLANDMYNRAYGEYADQLGAWQADRAYYYDKEQAELAQRNYENKLAMQMEAAAAKGGGGGGGSKSSGGSGSAAKSADYKTISKTAAGMTPNDAYSYVSRMVDGGYLTPEEGERILGVEMGLDMSKYAGGGTSSNGSQGFFSKAMQQAKQGVNTVNALRSALDKAAEQAAEQKALDDEEKRKKDQEALWNSLVNIVQR